MNESSFGNPSSPVSPARRLTQGPIVTEDMLEGSDGKNINGPALILAPEWLPQRLGRFYLYFAHHRGRYIRLAYADRVEGPWTVHRPGTLQLANATGCRDHIASPDVHIDHANKKIYMFFHGVEAGGDRQSTFLASSRDGVHFEAGEALIDNFYLRMVQWRNTWIGMAKGGVMYRSDAGFGNLRQLTEPAFPMKHRLANAPGDVRHVALQVAGDELHIYFTRIGDKPERIFRARIDLLLPPENWHAKNIEPVLAPSMEWEGADLTPNESQPGASTGRENAVRDPAIFVHDARTYLLYSVAGESGIGIAEIMPNGWSAQGSDRPKPHKPGVLISAKLPNPSNLAMDTVYFNTINRLAQPGNLDAQMAVIDRDRPPLKRIYVMGCG
ncbi:MAG: hypothetical protein ACHP7O_14075, partial [Burkholderiales bacterium]